MSEPLRPRSPDVRRQDQLSDELAQLVHVGVVADAIRRPLAQDLLVDTGAVAAVRSYVVGGPLQLT